MFSAPKKIVLRYWAYATTLWSMFSFVFLLKTLFSPWKNITEAYPSNKLDLVRIMQALTMNMTARGVGFVIRLMTIVMGIFIELAVLAYYVVYLALWITFPIIFVYSIQYLALSLI